MNRREALARVGLILGGTIVGADLFLSGCTNPTEFANTELDFSTDIIAFLDEVGETILPKTASSGGAKEAMIGDFMKSIVRDCYKEDDQKVFLEGIHKLNEAAQNAYNKDFVKLSPNEKHEFLVAIDKEAKEYSDNKKWEEPNHYFTLMKQLTLWGYFTSEVGSKQALRYQPLPGKYEGCIPYEKGDKAWSAI